MQMEIPFGTIHAMKVTKHVHTTTQLLLGTTFVSCDIYILLQPDKNFVLHLCFFLLFYSILSSKNGCNFSLHKCPGQITSL